MPLIRWSLKRVCIYMYVSECVRVWPLKICIVAFACVCVWACVYAFPVFYLYFLVLRWYHQPSIHYWPLKTQVILVDIQSKVVLLWDLSSKNQGQKSEIPKKIEIIRLKLVPYKLCSSLYCKNGTGTEIAVQITRKGALLRNRWKENPRFLCEEKKKKELKIERRKKQTKLSWCECDKIKEKTNVFL